MVLQETYSIGETLPINSSSIFSRALHFLRKESVNAPPDISYIVHPDCLPGSALSQTSDAYENSYATLVVEELRRRYGLTVATPYTCTGGRDMIGLKLISHNHE